MPYLRTGSSQNVGVWVAVVSVFHIGLFSYEGKFINLPEIYGNLRRINAFVLWPLGSFLVILGCRCPNLFESLGFVDKRIAIKCGSRRQHLSTASAVVVSMTSAVYSLFDLKRTRV